MRPRATLHFVPRKPREEVDGGVFHVFARGNDKRLIYRDDLDRRVYLRMLRGNTSLFEAGEGDVLLQEDADCHGFMFVSPEEEAIILAARASGSGTTEATAADAAA